jgi:hypothetical protein
MPNEPDSIEEDWKVARPVRRSPEEIAPQLSEPEDNYVWIVFAKKDGTHLCPRIRVQVPTNNEPVDQYFRNGRETEQLPVFKVDLRGTGLRYPLEVDQMYLFLNRAGHTLIACANGNRIPHVLSPITVWERFAFIISGSGKLYVLHQLPMTAPDDFVDHWEATPWESADPVGRAESMNEGFRQAYGLQRELNEETPGNTQTTERVVSMAVSPRYNATRL